MGKQSHQTKVEQCAGLTGLDQITNFVVLFFVGLSVVCETVRKKAATFAFNVGRIVKRIEILRKKKFGCKSYTSERFKVSNCIFLGNNEWH